MFPVRCSLLDTAVSPTKTDEPIQLLIGMWTQLGPNKLCIKWGPDRPQTHNRLTALCSELPR